MPEKELHLLLIEDDDVDRRTVQRKLDRPGPYRFHLHFASDLNSGLEFIRNNKVDLVLLDLNLPGSAGLANFTRINHEFPSIPVVILTGDDNMNMALEAIRIGAQDYLSKDSIKTELLSRVIIHAIERNYLRIELQRAKTAVEDMLLTDPLTGLLNRRGLETVLVSEGRRAQRMESGSHVLLVDLDNFKQINDRLGYAAGDVILKEVGKRIKASVRSTDHVARIGGDEFIIILSGARQAESIKIAQKIRLSVAESLIGVASGEKIKVTMSIGIVALISSDESIDRVLEKSHLALHQSKTIGKNVVSYQNTGLKASSDSNPLAETLDLLKGGSKIYAVAQPILDLETLKTTGYEMLSRLPLVEFCAPDDFFRLASEAKILNMVDRWCLRNCLLASFVLGSDLDIHVNLFPSTLIDVPTEQLLEEFPSGGKKRKFYVEISEQQIIGDPSYLLKAVAKLKKKGIGIAVDDVGFGNSCLESLILLEPEVVKIDRKCIHQISGDKGRQRSLKRLVQVIKSCESKAVAEGIELEEDLKIIQDLGITQGQGFLFGRPAKTTSLPKAA